MYKRLENNSVCKVAFNKVIQKIYFFFDDYYVCWLRYCPICYGSILCALVKSETNISVSTVLC